MAFVASDEEVSDATSATINVGFACTELSWFNDSEYLSKYSKAGFVDSRPAKSSQWE